MADKEKKTQKRSLFKLDEQICAPKGAFEKLCNVIMIEDQQKTIILSSLYIGIGIIFRYVLPIILRTIHFQDISLWVFFGLPFITMVGYFPVYIELQGILSLFILNITLFILFVILVFYSVGFDGLIPIGITFVLSVLTLPFIPLQIQVIAIVLSSANNLIPWEIIIVYTTLKAKSTMKKRS